MSPEKEIKMYCSQDEEEMEKFEKYIKLKTKMVKNFGIECDLKTEEISLAFDIINKLAEADLSIIKAKDILGTCIKLLGTSHVQSIQNNNPEFIQLLHEARGTSYF